MQNTNKTKNILRPQKYSEWLDEWLDITKINVKESTYVRYKSIIDNHIKPSLGNYYAEALTQKEIEQYIKEKLENGRIDQNGGLSPKTVSDQLLIIKDSFKYIQELSCTNICKINRIAIKKRPAKMRVLSITEEKKLLSVLLNEIDLYKLGIFLCLYTGIRIGELCALKWENISLSDRYIKIDKTLQRLPYPQTHHTKKTRIVITEPKTPSALRSIPFSDFLLEHLQSFECHPKCFLLSGKSDNFIEPRTMQNRFKMYIKESNIDDANFHSLRHTFATRCIEAGFDAKTLSEILGHSSVKITMDRYVHTTMDLKRLNMNKLQLLSR